MIQMKEARNAPKNEKEGKIYEGKLWKGNFFAWIFRYFVECLTWGNAGPTRSKEEIFRLISPESFFLEDYIDVLLDFSPKVGQKITIREGAEIYKVIRRSDPEGEYQKLLRKEELTNRSKLFAEDIILEKHPYLFAPSDPLFHSYRILEVTDIKRG